MSTATHAQLTAEISSNIPSGDPAVLTAASLRRYLQDQIDSLNVAASTAASVNLSTYQPFVNTTSASSGAAVLSLYDGTNACGWGTLNASTHVVSINISGDGGTSNPLTPPTQTTPVSSNIAVGATVADSTAGNIFQISSWVDNSSTRPTVAVFGQARATGTNGRVWGGNFVAYTGGSGAFSQTVEVDLGVSSSFTNQKAIGLSVNAGGATFSATNSSDVIGINFDQLSSVGTFVDAIRFSNFAGNQPYTNSLIKCNGSVTSTYGIDLSLGQFGTSPLKTAGFALSTTGEMQAVNTTAVASTATQAMAMSTTTGLGIYFATGQPTVSTAAQGSLCLSTGGSGPSTRAWVANSTGSWIALVAES